MELLKQYVKGKRLVEIWKTLRKVGKKNRRTTVYVIKQYTGAQLVFENTTTKKAKVELFVKKLKKLGYK